MRNIITAFGVGMGLAVSVLAGEEDLRSGGPWILTLVVFPVCALLCLVFILRDYRRRTSAEERRSVFAGKERSDSTARATEHDGDCPADGG
ncbi:hypothetical protein [Brevibacterium linens]|uniref:hypothetical protein n=1 Tax=Brevibacterium linens TaxID=1703 RepID=UPI000C781D3A|nr:hypothetical protein [Brevibacterium linens]KAB1944335.1 hypothetical protein F8227_14895 [Brevibacterium linens ATCC 9172]